MKPGFRPYEGGCTCRSVRYRVTREPMIVHCCHCRWCQRETGSAFVLNAIVEADQVALLQGCLDVVLTPSESGKGQKISRCPDCRVALWSNYPFTGEAAHFIRVGTLDDPDRWPPDVHIYTESKQPWVVLPPAMPVFERYYVRAELWSRESLMRHAALDIPSRAESRSAKSRP